MQASTKTHLGADAEDDVLHLQVVLGRQPVRVDVRHDVVAALQAPQGRDAKAKGGVGVLAHHLERDLLSLRCKTCRLNRWGLARD